MGRDGIMHGAPLTTTGTRLGSPKALGFGAIAVGASPSRRPVLVGVTGCIGHGRPIFSRRLRGFANRREPKSSRRVGVACVPSLVFFFAPQALEKTACRRRGRAGSASESASLGGSRLQLLIGSTTCWGVGHRAKRPRFAGRHRSMILPVVLSHLTLCGDGSVLRLKTGQEHFLSPVRCPTST